MKMLKKVLVSWIQAGIESDAEQLSNFLVNHYIPGRPQQKITWRQARMLITMDLATTKAREKVEEMGQTGILDISTWK